MLKSEAERILGLTIPYKEEDIRRAHHRLALKYHGDVSGVDDSMMTKINVARDTLLGKGSKKTNNSSFMTREQYMTKLSKIILGAEFLITKHADYFSVAYQTISGLINTFKISSVYVSNIDKLFDDIQNGIRGALLNLLNSFIISNGLNKKDFSSLNYDVSLKDFYNKLLEVVVNKKYDIGKIGILKEKLKKSKGYDIKYSSVSDVIIEYMLMKAIKLGYVGTAKESEIIEEYKSIHDITFCRYLEGKLWNEVKNLYKTEEEVKGVIEVWLIYFREIGCNPNAIHEILELARKNNCFENTFNNLVDEYSRLLKSISTIKDLGNLERRIKLVHELIELLLHIYNNNDAKKSVYIQCAIRKIDLNDLESIENGLDEINKLLNTKSNIYVLKKEGYYYGHMATFNLFYLKQEENSQKMCFFPSFTSNFVEKNHMEEFSISNKDIERHFISLEEFLNDVFVMIDGGYIICEKIQGNMVICISIATSGEITISKRYKTSFQNLGKKMNNQQKEIVIEAIKCVLETKYKNFVESRKK